MTTGNDPTVSDQRTKLTTFNLKAAPTPVGAYAHAKVAGGLLFLAGVGPRTPITNIIPGGPIRDPITREPLVSQLLRSISLLYQPLEL